MGRGRRKREYKSANEIREFGFYCVDLIYGYLNSEIEKEFEQVHLTKNLMETTFRQDFVSGYSKVTLLRIPATRYNINKFRKQGVFVYTPNRGSYAWQVNRFGGFSGKHTHYIERMVYNSCINFVNKVNNTIVDGKQVQIKKISWRNKYDRLF